MIRWMQPSLGRRELEAVECVFADAWPGAGPRVREFEQAFASHLAVPAEQMIAVTSCTEGLFQVLAALGLEDDEEVILPTVSYVGAAHAVRAAGARIRLADIDLRTLNPTVADIRRCMTSRTRAVLLLHFGGRAGWVEEIAELTRRNGVLLIEDAACAVGARAASGAACGTLGDIGLWSFDAMKLLTAGDGGMIRVARADVRQKIDRAIRLGGVRSGWEGAASADAWWITEPETTGRRAFMNDLTAAIALVQLSRLAELRQRRAKVAAAYDRLLESVDWVTRPNRLLPQDDAYFYWIQTTPKQRDAIAHALKQAGVYTTFRYWPLHRQSLYADPGCFPGADRAAAKTLLLPLHADLSQEEIARICDIILRLGPPSQ